MKRILLILGGDKPTPQLFNKAYACCDFHIAADSGIHVFQENHKHPNILTGDFDSITSLPRNSPTKIIPAPEQSANDFEKALRPLENEDWKELIILGGTGGRADHFLTNLLIAAALENHRKVCFIDPKQSIYRITPDTPFTSMLPCKRLISLIPFTRANRVSTRGLKWNLDESDMFAPVLLGLSNYNESENIHVTIGDGSLYLVINEPEGESALRSNP